MEEGASNAAAGLRVESCALTNDTTAVGGSLAALVRPHGHPLQGRYTNATNATLKTLQKAACPHSVAIRGYLVLLGGTSRPFGGTLFSRYPRILGGNVSAHKSPQRPPRAQIESCSHSASIAPGLRSRRPVDPPLPFSLSLCFFRSGIVGIP